MYASATVHHGPLFNELQENPVHGTDMVHVHLRDVYLSLTAAEAEELASLLLRAATQVRANRSTEHRQTLEAIRNALSDPGNSAADCYEYVSERLAAAGLPVRPR